KINKVKYEIIQYTNNNNDKDKDKDKDKKNNKKLINKSKDINESIKDDQSSSPSITIINNSKYKLKLSKKDDNDNIDKIFTIKKNILNTNTNNVNNNDNNNNNCNNNGNNNNYSISEVDSQMLMDLITEKDTINNNKDDKNDKNKIEVSNKSKKIDEELKKLDSKNNIPHLHKRSKSHTHSHIHNTQDHIKKLKTSLLRHSNYDYYNYRLYLLNKSKNQLKKQLMKYKLLNPILSHSANSHNRKIPHIYGRSGCHISYYNNCCLNNRKKEYKESPIKAKSKERKIEYSQPKYDYNNHVQSSLTNNKINNNKENNNNNNNRNNKHQNDKSKSQKYNDKEEDKELYNSEWEDIIKNIIKRMILKYNLSNDDITDFKNNDNNNNKNNYKLNINLQKNQDTKIKNKRSNDLINQQQVEIEELKQEEEEFKQQTSTTKNINFRINHNLKIDTTEDITEEELQELKFFKADIIHFFGNIQENKTKSNIFIMDDKGDLDKNGLTLSDRLKFMNHGEQLKKKCFQLIRLYNIFSNQLDEVIKNYT
ncbi:hypothetical protein BCR32DRAFT_301675, partial [Anaeromyces robustus]